MAYKQVHRADVPKKPRKGISRFERTPEWARMRADLEKGFKPNDALVVILTDEDKRKYRIRERRTVARFLTKYLTDHKLPYQLKSFHRENEGDVFVIQYPARRP